MSRKSCWYEASDDSPPVGRYSVRVRVAEGQVVDAAFTVTPKLVNPPSALVAAGDALVGLQAHASWEQVLTVLSAVLEAIPEVFEHAGTLLTALVRDALAEAREPEGWRFVDALPQIARVPRICEHKTTGLEPDLTAWEDHTWVLHACYRNPELAQFGTADELRRALLAEGLVEPDMVGDVSLDDLCQTTGIVIGWSPVPGPDWHRVRWAEFAALAAPQQYPPSYQWCTAYNDADFEGLNEGSMDEATWKALAAVLAAFLPHGAQSHVFALHCGMVASYLAGTAHSPGAAVASVWPCSGSVPSC